METEVKVETEDVKYSDDDCGDNDFLDVKPVEQGLYGYLSMSFLVSETCKKQD